MGRQHTEYYDRHTTKTNAPQTVLPVFLPVEKAPAYTWRLQSHYTTQRSNTSPATWPCPSPQPWVPRIGTRKCKEASSTRIQAYLHLLLNLQEEKKPRKRKSRPRREYVRPWIKERAQYGHYHQLLPELQAHDPDTFRYYLQVDYGLFQQILQRIKPHIQRQDTNWRQAF